MDLQTMAKRNSSEATRDLARALLALADAQSDCADPVTLAIGDTTVDLPGALLPHLHDLLQIHASGGLPVVQSSRGMLTTQQAAALLDMSRPHLVKLLESGAMPFERVGSHRRIRHEHVMAYRARQRELSRQALDELTREAQEFGAYDE